MDNFDHNLNLDTQHRREILQKSIDENKFINENKFTEEVAMKYVWDEFIDYYGYKLHKYPLSIILEAFWHYVKEEDAKCDAIFSHYDKKLNGQ